MMMTALTMGVLLMGAGVAVLAFGLAAALAMFLDEDE